MDFTDYDMLLELATCCCDLAIVVSELNERSPLGEDPKIKDLSYKVQTRSFALRVYLAELMGKKLKPFQKYKGATNGREGRNVVPPKRAREDRS